MRLTTWNAQLRVCSSSIDHRPLPRCGEMRSSAGRREDWLEVYLYADRAYRRRVVAARAPTIRMRGPCHSDIRKPPQPDMQRFRRLLRLTPGVLRRIRLLVFGPNAHNSQ